MYIESSRVTAVWYVYAGCNDGEWHAASWPSYRRESLNETPAEDLPLPPEVPVQEPPPKPTPTRAES